MDNSVDREMDNMHDTFRELNHDFHGKFLPFATIVYSLFSSWWSGKPNSPQFICDGTEFKRCHIEKHSLKKIPLTNGFSDERACVLDGAVNR